MNDNTASIIGALGGLGIESYEISTGAPVAVSSVGGVTTVQAGSAVTQNSLFAILGIVALAVVAYFILR